MESLGFRMVRCIQGPKTLSLPLQRLSADLRAHRVNYGNNPVLKWNLANCALSPQDRNGNQLLIKNQDPRKRIDGVAALLDCFVGLLDHMAEFTALEG